LSRSARRRLSIRAVKAEDGSTTFSTVEEER